MGRPGLQYPDRRISSVRDHVFVNGAVRHLFQNPHSRFAPAHWLLKESELLQASQYLGADDMISAGMICMAMICCAMVACMMITGPPVTPTLEPAAPRLSLLAQQFSLQPVARMQQNHGAWQNNMEPFVKLRTDPSLALDSLQPAPHIPRARKGTYPIHPAFQTWMAHFQQRRFPWPQSKSSLSAP